MKESTQKKLLLASGVVNSILIIALCALLAALCVGIYNSGPSPFSRESVGLALEKALPLICVTLGFILAGGVMRLCFNVKKRPTVQRDPLGDLPKHAVNDEAKRERRFRSICKSGLFGAVLATAVFCSVYTANSPFGTENVNLDIARVCLVVFAAFLLCILLTALCISLCKKSAVRERALGGGREAAEQKGHQYRKYITLFVFALGLILLIAGLSTGGMDAVIQKAINICTECIGLG